MTLPWMIEPAVRTNDAASWHGCANCAHFETRPLLLERALPGLATLASGFASVSADDGYCRRHERLLAASSACAQHLARRKPG